MRGANDVLVFLVAVLVVPRNAIWVAAAAVFGFDAAIASVLPFFIIRQPVLPAGLGVELFQEFLHVVPAHLFHGAGVAAVFKVAGVATHDVAPFFLRHVV